MSIDMRLDVPRGCARLPPNPPPARRESSLCGLPRGSNARLLVARCHAHPHALPRAPRRRCALLRCATPARDLRSHAKLPRAGLDASHAGPLLGLGIVDLGVHTHQDTPLVNVHGLPCAARAARSRAARFPPHTLPAALAIPLVDRSSYPYIQCPARVMLQLDLFAAVCSSRRAADFSSASAAGWGPPVKCRFRHPNWLIAPPPVKFPRLGLNGSLLAGQTCTPLLPQEDFGVGSVDRGGLELAGSSQRGREQRPARDGRDFAEPELRFFRRSHHRCAQKPYQQP